MSGFVSSGGEEGLQQTKNKNEGQYPANLEELFSQKQHNIRKDNFYPATYKWNNEISIDLVSGLMCVT